MEAPDFFVEDLLDLPNGDEMMPDAFFDTSSAVHSCNSFFSSGTDHHLLSDLPNPHAPELCVPYEDMAELEWLSNFVEESFSSEGAFKAVHQQQQSLSAVPGRVRSKLARVAPSDWSTRVLMVSEAKKPASRRRGENPDSTKDGEVRRCLHCAAEKTPQWRTGPMGPKTLCNACGVRYKSGRLVPEYRPAASPTFVSARHSNSHRKVMELRRQKDVLHSSRQQPHFRGEASAPGVYVGSGGEDFLIHHHHMGTDYRQLI